MIQKQPHRVAIVVDREYGSRISELAQRLHVWICDSPINRPAVESTWRACDRKQDLASGATIFDCAPDMSAEDALVEIIGTVDLHHGEYSHDPPWSVIEVIGSPPTPRVRSTFADFGAKVVEEENHRFVVCRPPAQGPAAAK